MSTIRTNTITDAAGTGAPDFPNGVRASAFTDSAGTGPANFPFGATGISTTPTTEQVLNATAGAAVGAVGTYAFLGETDSNTLTNPGGTRAGSALRYAGFTGNASFANQFTAVSSATGINTAPAGTWRCMGMSRNDAFDGRFPATLWLRIS